MGFEDVCGAAAQGQPMGSVLGEDWRVLVFVGLLITLACLAVLYMVANFIRHTKLIAWVNFELFQVVATGVLAAIIMAWIAGACSFPANMLATAEGQFVKPDGKSMNVYEAADDYLNWGEKIGRDVFIYSIAANYYIGKLTSFHFNFDPVGVGSKMTPLGAFSQMSNLVSVMMSAYMVSYLVLMSQIYIIKYIVLAMPYFFLPLGLLMRALSPTREFGGAMVGLAITLMVFYPLTLIFNDVLVRQPIVEAFEGMGATIGSIFSNFSLMGSIALMSVGAMLGPAAIIPTGVAAVFTMYQVLQIFIRAAVYYFLLAVVLPVFNFIFIIAIAKDLSKVLGDEVDVTNLTRMI